MSNSPTQERVLRSPKSSLSPPLSPIQVETQCMRTKLGKILEEKLCILAIISELPEKDQLLQAECLTNLINQETHIHASLEFMSKL